jgi:glycerol-3-phosphate dehydrogenase
VMARDLVDTVLEESGVPPRSCSTQAIPLVGSSLGTEHAAPIGLRISQGERAALDSRYGSRVREVFDVMAAQPHLMAPLPEAEGFWLAEVVHACVNEGAVLLDDLLDRRLRLGLNLERVASETVRAAARTMGGTMGWDDADALDAAAAYETSHRPLWMSSASMMR